MGIIILCEDLLRVQVLPFQWLTHSQTKSATRSMQKPPLRQGFGEHSFLSMKTKIKLMKNSSKFPINGDKDAVRVETYLCYSGLLPIPPCRYTGSCWCHQCRCHHSDRGSLYSHWHLSKLMNTLIYENLTNIYVKKFSEREKRERESVCVYNSI